MVGTGRFEFGGDADDGSVGGTERGGGRDGRDGDGDRQLIKWEDNIEKITLGTEPNDPLTYDPGLEPHHPVMSTLGAHECQLEIKREIYQVYQH